MASAPDMHALAQALEADLRREPERAGLTPMLWTHTADESMMWVGIGLVCRLFVGGWAADRSDRRSFPCLLISRGAVRCFL